MARPAALALAGLFTLVLVSSWLGLSARLALTDPVGSFAFMANIWSLSVVADVAFAGGTILAGLAAFVLATRWNVAGAIVLSALMHWVVYAVSFLLLPSVSQGTEVSVAERGVANVFQFVALWGVFGLVFCALAPPIVAWRWAKRSRAAL